MILGNDDATRTLVHEDDEYAAKMVQDYPGRFGHLAALPLPDQDASLKEIEHALDTLKSDGIALVTSYGDQWAGRPIFRARLRGTEPAQGSGVRVIPSAPTCCAELVPKIPESWVEYDFDTSRAFNSLLVNGAFSKYPNIRFILCIRADRCRAFGRLGRHVPNRRGRRSRAERCDGGKSANCISMSRTALPAAMDALTDVVPASANPLWK